MNAPKTTVITIVRAHLEANGFDGLVQPDAECACLLDDLRPCDSDFSECRPGYKHLTPNDPQGDEWRVSTNKDWKPSVDEETNP